MITKIFVNLPVKDLGKSMEFFSNLGYSFDPRFTDEKAGCLVISEHIFAMLVTEKFFKTFTKKKIANAKEVTEALLALSVESKEEVDDVFNRAIESGGKINHEPEDLDWMYTKSFQDLDGHVWEVFYMDENKMPKTP
ncbi:MAG: VOC family protein [Candidatus Paceibacterota bacterium]|jgi:predicted lactoylglutathione lyase